MMKYLPFLAVVLLMLSGGLRSEATAGAQVAASMVNGTIRSSDLLVKIKHKKKHNKDNDDNDDQSSSGDEDDAALSECTIQQPGGGGGCKGGLKYVCEELKNGKKCCGCVGDKTKGAGTAQKPSPTTDKPFNCEADVLPATVGHAGLGGFLASSQADANAKFNEHVASHNWTLNGPVTCTEAH